MVDSVVRRATLDDITELARIESVARAAIVDVRGGALLLDERPPIRDWAGMVADDRVVALVGELEGHVVGMLVMQLRADLDRGMIGVVFVEPEARELGFGDALVETAIDAARDAGLRGIEATALPGDRATKNLFERFGLTARSLTVYRRVDPVNAPNDD